MITSHNNSDVYLSLNGTVIPNHGYVEIDDIGSTDDTALPNRPPPTPGANSGGDWFAPDRTRVYGTYVPGIIRVRGPMVVRLKRTSGDPPEGIYRCSLLDNTSEVIHLYVGLYNSGQGCIECLGLGLECMHERYIKFPQELSQFLVVQPSLWTQTISSPSPVSPPEDLLPLSLGPETPSLSLKELRLC